MDDLAERIKASIENPHGELWFPELPADLVARAWGSLHREIGLTPDTYGTERVLSRSLSAPLEIITSVRICASTCMTAPAISIEALSQESAAEYQKKGVRFYSPDEILHSPVLACLENALSIINQVPSLMRTVSVLVRSLHVIEPMDEDHDVSFSEPHVPFSIFVSVPGKRIANDSLRAAEAIVHEAMHLQLTLIEAVRPLINQKDGEYFSPWRQEYRNAQGLLHGLYVFRVISQFFGDLNVSDSSEQDYVSGRRSEIAAEINQTRSFSHCPELTCLGSAFVSRLLYASVMNLG